MSQNSKYEGSQYVVKIENRIKEVIMKIRFLLYRLRINRKSIIVPKIVMRVKKAIMLYGNLILFNGSEIYSQAYHASS